MWGGKSPTFLAPYARHHDLGLGVQLGAVVVDALHKLDARVDIAGKAAVLPGALSV